MHIPELGGGLTTSSKMLSPCWTTCVSAHTTAVLEISLAAARTATTTTASAPRPFSAALCGCRMEAAAALSFISERQELLPADSVHLPVRKVNKQTNRARGRSKPESGVTPTRQGAQWHRTAAHPPLFSGGDFNAPGTRRDEGTTEAAVATWR